MRMRHSQNPSQISLLQIHQFRGGLQHSQSSHINQRKANPTKPRWTVKISCFWKKKSWGGSRTGNWAKDRRGAEEHRLRPLRAGDRLELKAMGSRRPLSTVQWRPPPGAVSVAGSPWEGSRPAGGTYAFFPPVQMTTTLHRFENPRRKSFQKSLTMLIMFFFLMMMMINLI